MRLRAVPQANSDHNSECKNVTFVILSLVLAGQERPARRQVLVQRVEYSESSVADRSEGRRISCTNCCRRPRWSIELLSPAVLQVTVECRHPAHLPVGRADAVRVIRSTGCAWAAATEAVGFFLCDKCNEV